MRQDPSSQQKVVGTGDLEHALVEAMLRSRCVDRFLAELGQRGRLSLVTSAHKIEAHLYGALSALRPSDWVFGDPRSVSVPLERGMAVRSWLAQLLGTASSGELGHSAMLSSPEARYVSCSPLMGTQLVHAMGVALAMKRKGSSDCVLSWFGPGAAASGESHVALNFAGVYRTPSVFYFVRSGSTEQDEARVGSADFVDRGQAYGIPAFEVDGGDALAVRDVVVDAVERARGGSGPTLIVGHTGADPLANFTGDTGGITAPFESTLRAALESLSADGSPDLATLFDEVYSELPSSLDEQLQGLLAHKARFSGGEIS